MVNTATHPVVELDYNKAPDVAVTPSLGNTQILGSNGALYLIPQLPEVTTAEYSHQDRSSNTAADARIHKSVVASDQLPPRQEDTAGLGRPLGRHFDLDHLNSSDHESFKPKLPSTTSFTEPQRAQLNNEGVNKDYEARSSPHSTPDSSTANLITSQPLHLIFESVRKGLEITTSLHSPFEPPETTLRDSLNAFDPHSTCARSPSLLSTYDENLEVPSPLSTRSRPSARSASSRISVKIPKRRSSVSQVITRSATLPPRLPRYLGRHHSLQTPALRAHYTPRRAASLSRVLESTRPSPADLFISDRVGAFHLNGDHQDILRVPPDTRFKVPVAIPSRVPRKLGSVSSTMATSGGSRHARRPTMEDYNRIMGKILHSVEGHVEPLVRGTDAAPPPPVVSHGSVKFHGRWCRMKSAIRRVFKK